MREMKIRLVLLTIGVAVTVGLVITLVTAEIYFQGIERERENLISLARQTDVLLARTSALARKLKKELRDKGVQIQQLKQEYEYLERKLKEKEMELENSSRFQKELLSEIKRLKEDNYRLNILLAESKKNQQMVLENAISVTSEKSESEHLSGGTHSVSGSTYNTTVMLKVENDNLRQKLMEKERELQDVRKRIGELQAGTREVASLKKKSEALSLEVAGKQKEVAELEEKLKEVTLQYEQLKNKYADLKRKVQEQSKELAERADRIVRLQDKLEDIQKANKNTEDMVQKYLKELAQLRENYVAIKLENLHLREELARSKQQLLSFKGEIDAVKDINNQLREQIDKLAGTLGGKDTGTEKKKVEVKLESVDTGAK